jgi:hypothetical protein
MENVPDSEYIQSEQDSEELQLISYAQMLEIAEHERFEDIREIWRSGGLSHPK